MELRNVTTFLRVAELENFTRAAADLGYAQSTVTIQIRQLEDELGYRLFDRIGKRISLTPQGETFLVYANQLAAVSQQIKAIGPTQASFSSGLLRLGILESLFAHIFLPQLPQYHANYPWVRIRTKTASGDELFECLRRNELDIIFMLGRKISEYDCIRAYERQAEIAFIASADSPYAVRRALSLQEIANMPLLLTEHTGYYRKALEQIAAELDIALNPLLEVDNTAALISLVKLGMGVSLLPIYTVQEQIDQGKLVALQVSNCKIMFWMQVFYHKNKWVTPQMQGFIDTIQSHCERAPEGDAGKV